MSGESEKKRFLVTGTAGFIGFHLAKLLLEEGHQVHGYDGITDYYDISLKQKRHEILEGFPNFSCTIGMLENTEVIDGVFDDFQPEVVVHLAAQAGVRYSLENPRAYIDSNVVGTFNVMEAARRLGVKHLLMASIILFVFILLVFISHFCNNMINIGLKLNKLIR